VTFHTGRSAGAATLAALLTLAPTYAAAQITAYAYVPNTGSANVTVIETISGTVLGAPIPVGAFPTNSAAMPDGTRVYVTCLNAGTVSVIDLATGTTGTPIVVGTQPFGLAILPNGRKVYVANLGGGGVSVIDTATNMVVTTITVGTNPAGVAVSPDGSRVYVANNGSNTVSVIDPATDTVIGPPITVGANPGGLVVTPDGQHLYVSNFGGNSVSVVDLALGSTVTTIPVGLNPAGTAISPDGSQVAVANNTSNSVSRIATATNTLLPALSPGGTSARAVSYTPDGQTLYIVNQGSNNVSRVDVASGIVSPTTIPTGNTPDGFGYFMTPPILTTSCAGCGTLSIASDADLTALGVRSFVIFNSGVLSLNGDWTTSRNVSLLANHGAIDTHGFNATISGDVVNGGALTKTGAGTLTLAGAATHGGGTILLQGTLIVNGSHLSAITVQNATLGGNGAVGIVNVAALGTISPGVGGPGILHAGDVVLNGSAFVAQINGPVAGTGYDRLEVSGTATLNNPTLTVQPGYVPAPGAVFTILTHATGTFAGLPDNAIINAGGVHLRLSYHGGGGSDVTLTNDAPPTVAGLTNQTIVAGGTLGPIAFTVADDVTPAASLVVSATSSNHALLPDADILFGGSGGARTLTATPVPGASGVTTITVSVSDALGQVGTQQFTLTVTPLPVYYLAEGATGGFFSTDLLLANPNSVSAPIVVTFFKDDGTTVVQNRTLPATSRTTVRVNEIAGLEAAAFSASVSSTDGVPLIVERTMWWDPSGYGAHTEKASPAAAAQWYFAEGSQGFFHTFFLLLNPHAVDTIAHVTYFLESGPAVQRDYTVPATSRRTIDAGSEAALINQSFGALITFDLPGMAERAMYFGTTPLFSGGHASSGVTAPNASWFFAEGATGTFFDTFLLIANPNDANANVTITYLPDNGVPIPKTHLVAGHQRLTINIATEDPALASAAMSAQVTSDQPVIAERSQYWPRPAWYESHNSAGETAMGTKWGLAEGRVGGTNHAQTYILIANPGTLPADITATFLRADGTTLVKTFQVQPTSRFNIAVTGPGSNVPELADESFGAVIASTQPVIVERSLYTDAGSVIWAAGTNATATRLP
jgi:YVTN family beta-propeller protein/autotransporter-associated beta strand protein